MSLINSVLGSISPQFRESFEDSRAQEHELPSYRSSPSSPRIPPPIASTVLWSVPATNFSPPPRVPDDLLALQRKARHLERQLQELLDAQADGLMSGLENENNGTPDDLVSNGSTTPTVSSIRETDRSADSEDNSTSLRKKKIGLSAARKGIFRRIQQLASIKTEELDYLDEDLKSVQLVVGKVDAWGKKRARLDKKIKDIEGEDGSSRTEVLQTEAAKLEREIRQKEEELMALKVRQRRVLAELSTSENAVEARLSSYKASLSILDKDVADFLSRPPKMNHVPLSSSPFLALPPRRRTLEMAQDYWHEEYTRLTEKCEEVDMERSALDEGAVVWNDVIKKVADFEASLQDLMQHNGLDGKPDASKLLEKMGTTIAYLEDKVEFVKARNWNLLFLAIGAELEAFKQGKDMLENTLGMRNKGKNKVIEQPADTKNPYVTEVEEEMSRSAIRIGRASPPKPALPSAPPRFFDTDDEDPDPELMISHQDTDTD